MKTLLLIRHGKSDWVAGLSDKDRPLNQRGIMDAHQMGQKLKIQGIIPEFMFVSSAKRTTKTAEILSDYYDLEKEHVISCPELYLCEVEDIFDTVECLDNEINIASVVAHNPCLSYLASQLSSLDYVDMPTMGIFIVQFDTDEWDNLRQAKVISTQLITPR